MMPGRVRTSSQPWYRNFSVCNRKQRYTTVTCLLVLSVCFTYFSFYGKNWRVKLVPDKPLPRSARGPYQVSDTLTKVTVSKSREASPSVPTPHRVGQGGIVPKAENRSAVNTQRHIEAIADALNLPNGGRTDGGNTPPSVHSLSGISSELGMLRKTDQTEIRPDSNSIEGSLKRPIKVEENDKYIPLKNDRTQDRVAPDYRHSRPTVDGRVTLSNVPTSTDLSSSLGEYSDSTERIPTGSSGLTSKVPTAYQSVGSSLDQRTNTVQASYQYHALITVVQQKMTKTNSAGQTVSSRNTESMATLNYTSPAQSDSGIQSAESSDSTWQTETTQNSGVKVTTEKEEIFYDPHEVDLLSVEPLKFMTDYRNPCWVENVTTWYTDNVYLEVQNVRAVLTRMSATLRLRQERGDYHRVRCLPYFFIIGQPKCGSTDLYEKLTAHPEAVRPPTKEPHWWTRTRLGRHRAYGHVVTLADYTDLFDYAGYNIEQHPKVIPDSSEVYHRMVTGEGSMSTFWDNDHWWAMVGNENTSEPRVLNPDYVHHVLPNAKLILILRNPTTRMYSDYLYFRKADKVPQTFHNDVVNAISVYENCSREAPMRSCAYNSSVSGMAKIRLRVGLYSIFMRDWLRVFPREQFFIVRTEDYAAKPREVLRQLYSFLDLQELSESHLTRILSRKKANTRRAQDKLLGDMLPETRTLLNNFYRPFNQELADLLRDDQFLWTDGENNLTKS